MFLERNLVLTSALEFFRERVIRTRVLWQLLNQLGFQPFGSGDHLAIWRVLGEERNSLAEK